MPPRQALIHGASAVHCAPEVLSRMICLACLARAYHLGTLRVLNDFPILWEWVVEFPWSGREAYAHALNLLPSAGLADGAILRVRRLADGPVSYTHLTLPTIYSV